MQVEFDPAAPHLLRLLATTTAEQDTLGTLCTQGPLTAARKLTERQPGGGHLVVGLEWDTRGCPTVGAAVSPADVLRREAAGKLASGLGELLCLALRQMQGHGVVQPDSTTPHPHEQAAAFFEQLQLVKLAFAADTGSEYRRSDEVKGTHEAVSRLFLGAQS